MRRLGLGLGVAVAAAVAIHACGPESDDERQLCFERAEVYAELRVDLECPGLLSTCPAATDIMAELRREFAACQ